jgi:spore coat protein U-like protein
MNSFFRRVALAAVASAAAAAPAYAGTQTQNMNVSANVTANCVLSTAAMAFGDYNATANVVGNTSANISVTCTNGLGWTASADAGAGEGATVTQRRLEAAVGDSQLAYNLYTNPGRTTVWGTGVDGNGATIEQTGTGVAQSIPIYGQIEAGQTGAQVGSYSDTVVVTVSY